LIGLRGHTNPHIANDAINSKLQLNLTNRDSAVWTPDESVWFRVPMPERRAAPELANNFSVVFDGLKIELL
jgi:hypothetical protein